MPKTTSKSLLQRAKRNPRSEAWFQLNRIYEPLISGWIVRAGVEGAEVGDITQEVMQTLARDISGFEHNGRVGAFRNWLKTIAVNRCRRYWDSKKRQVSTRSLENETAAAKVLNELEDPVSGLSQLWNMEHDNYVLEKIRLLVQKEFTPEDYDVFTRNTLKGQSAKAISDELGISVSKIYKIKFRILTRLKEAAEGLLDAPLDGGRSGNEIDDSTGDDVRA